MLERINEVKYRVEMKNGKTQVIQVNRMKPCLTGSARLKEMDEVSNLSEAETVKLYATDESDDESEVMRIKIPLERPLPGSMLVTRSQQRMIGLQRTTYP